MRFSSLRTGDTEARLRRIETFLRRQGNAPTNAAIQQSAGAAATGIQGIINAAGGGGVGDGTVTLAGDVTGANIATTVVQIEGTPIPAPAAGDDAKFIQYVNATPAFAYANVPLAGDVTGDNTAAVVGKLLGIVLAAAASVAGQGYVYNGSQFALVKPQLFDHYADVGNGAGETDLYSDTLAAGQLAANGQKILAQYGGTFTGAALSTQQLRAYFGGTLIFDSGALAIGAFTDSWDLKVAVIRESSSVVRCSVGFVSNFGTLGADAAYTRVTGLTLTNTQVLKVTGTAAGAGAVANQIVASMGFVEWRLAA